MKFLDKLALKIFSLIIFVIGIGLILIMTNILTPQMIYDQVIRWSDAKNALQIFIGVLGVLMLLSLKGLFFTSKPESNGKEGIILENTSGKLVISKESLESLVASVTKDIPGSDTVSSKTILDKHGNLIVYVTTTVSKDVMIKDISNELQKRVKEAMRKTADLEVKEVNIKIKNITSKKVKGLPSPTNEEETNSDETGEEISENNSEEGEE